LTSMEISVHDFIDALRITRKTCQNLTLILLDEGHFYLGSRTLYSKATCNCNMIEVSTLIVKSI
jgi:hypothetical protein